jgi:hypothetical protein
MGELNFTTFQYLIRPTILKYHHSLHQRCPETDMPHKGPLTIAIRNQKQFHPSWNLETLRHLNIVTKFSISAKRDVSKSSGHSD